MAGARRREAALLAALALVVIAVVAVELLAGGGSKPRRPAAPPPPTGIEPLAFMPGDATAVMDLDTDVPAVAVAAAELVPRIPGSTLSEPQVRALVGGRMAVAFGAGRMYLAAVTRAPAPRGVASAKHGGTVVVAPSAAALRTVLAVSGAAAPGARAAFDARVRGLPRSAARIAFDAGAFLRSRSPKLAATAWGRSLRGGAAALVSRASRVVLPFRVAAEGAAQLPFAPGAAAPHSAGSGPIVAAVRSPGQTLAFLRSAGMLPALDVLASAPGFLRPDLSDLGPEATITTRDLKVLTVRFTPPNPGDWATKLSRLDALSGLIRFTGIADVRIDRARDGSYTIQQDGQLAGRAGVFGRVVVFSTDPAADLRAAARAPVAAPPAGAAGGLTLRLGESLFGPLLPALARGHVGDVSGWARVEPSGTTGELSVPVR